MTGFPDGELDHAVEVGAVDDRSVRVWVRFSNHASVFARLETPGQPPVVEVITLSAASDWTAGRAITLPAPAPSARFTLTVSDITREGHFAPTRGTPGALTFGFGSCHMPFAEDEDGQIVVRKADAAIYPAIRADLKRAGGQLLLLSGDQIYADGLRTFSVRADLPGIADQPPPVEELLTRYRQVYRGFFNEAGFRELRETFPFVGTWDDHEIFDNWGSTAEKTPTDLQLFAAASRAYAEYQYSRTAWGDRSGPPFHWIQHWGDIAILGLDVRSERDYETGTLAGAHQWERLQEWLTGDESRDVATLFVVSSVPVAHTARWFTRIFDFMPTGFSEPIRDRWSSSGFIDSRDQLLDALFAWETVARNRQVIILSGDVHCASAFTIRQRNGPGVIQQVTSSAMTTQLDLRQTVFNRTVVHGTNLFEGRYRFERRFLSLANNYGGVRVDPLPGGGHRIIVAIRSWDPKRRRLRTTDRMLIQPESVVTQVP